MRVFLCRERVFTYRARVFTFRARVFTYRARVFTYQAGALFTFSLWRVWYLTGEGRSCTKGVRR